jgi:hypothetical protein
VAGGTKIVISVIQWPAKDENDRWLASLGVRVILSTGLYQALKAEWQTRLKTAQNPQTASTPSTWF